MWLEHGQRRQIQITPEPDTPQTQTGQSQTSLSRSSLSPRKRRETSSQNTSYPQNEAENQNEGDPQNEADFPQNEAIFTQDAPELSQNGHELDNSPPHLEVTPENIVDQNAYHSEQEPRVIEYRYGPEILLEGTRKGNLYFRCQISFCKQPLSKKN